ncbi:MAG: hypothetical protein ACYCVH_16635 [Ignavibacteriaceae bacterium]
MKVALTGGKIITPFRILNDGVLIFENRKISELGKSSDIVLLKNGFNIKIHIYNLLILSIKDVS